jgi:hypothetical protein
MNELPSNVLACIFQHLDYQFNFAMINRKCYNVAMTCGIKSMKLRKCRMNIDLLEWIYSVINVRLFSLQFEYTYCEKMIIFYHEHSPVKLDMVLETAKNGHYDQLYWCLAHGWHLTPEAEAFLESS